MKAVSKVALAGLGIGALYFFAKGGPMALMMFDRPQKMSPEDEKRWHGRKTLPAVMRLPDGSMVRVAPDGRTILGPVVAGNPRGHYG